MKILFLFVLSFHAIFAEVCPSTRWTCPKFMTCCVLPSGQEGCCPYENATCCMDRVHCCPQGSTCDVRGGHCRTDLKTSPVVQLHSFLATANISSTTNKVCPDGKQCQDQSTCCVISSGGYGCCPYPNGVCCSDEQYCCPSNTTCNSTGFCNMSVEENVAIEKNKRCPGGRYQCKSEDTCCLMASGDWGCCPLPDAVCCSDKLHCCPRGYHCLPSGNCIKASNVPWKN